MVEEDILPTDFLVQAGRKTYVSYGMEIEQPPDLIPGPVRRKFDWHRDGSGPLETSLSPTSFPMRQLYSFLKKVRPDIWVWKTQYQGSPVGIPPRRRCKGCGSHIHFRVREDEIPPNLTVEEAWTIVYNTIVELVPILAPFFSWNHLLPFRASVWGWAHPNIRRYSPLAVRTFLDPEYYGRRYDYVTWNRKPPDERGRQKPLTIEVRLNEAHPSIVSAGAMVLQGIIRNCVERGWSVKLENRTRILNEQLLERFYESSQSFLSGDNIWQIMEQTDRLVFIREIPKLKHSYRNAKECFIDIVKTYRSHFRWTYRERVASLLQKGYNPADNPNAVWYVDAPIDEFSWEIGPRVR